MALRVPVEGIKRTVCELKISARCLVIAMGTGQIGSSINMMGTVFQGGAVLPGALPQEGNSC